MSRASRMLAGILLVVLPSVMYGGVTLLSFLSTNATGYVDNPLRQDLFRAGHAHAGVYLVLSLVMLRYVDEATLSPFWKWLARTGAPIAAFLIPAAFFSVGRFTRRQRAQQFDQPRRRWRILSCCRRVNSGHWVDSCRAAPTNALTYVHVRAVSNSCGITFAAEDKRDERGLEGG